MENIKWIFFDLGSTLIDESDCLRERCKVIIEQNNLDAEKFHKTVIKYAEKDAFAIRWAAQEYGVQVPKWFGELEKLYPNVEEILKKLSSKYKLGIIANQISGTQKRIDNWGIGKYFDVVVASAEAGCEKPDLKIFNLALEQANCEPNEAVMIGDRLDNDVAPAKQLGMKTVWVRQGFAKYQSVKHEIERPDYIVESINDVLDLFKTEHISNITV